MLYLNACGIQMPVSEGLVFSSSEPYGQKHVDILPFLRYGGAVTAVSTVPMYSQLEEDAVGKYGDAQSRQLNHNLMTAGGNPGFGASFGNGRRFAIAFTPGLMLTGMHADATARVLEKVFFTVNHHFAIGDATEIILQRPVLEKRGGGVSIGGFFRRQPMQFVESDEGWFGGEPRFNIQWYGVRIMGQTPTPQNSNMHVRGFLNAGYVQDYEIPMIAVGLAISFD